MSADLACRLIRRFAQRRRQRRDERRALRRQQQTYADDVALQQPHIAPLADEDVPRRKGDGKRAKKNRDAPAVDQENVVAVENGAAAAPAADVSSEKV